MTASTIVGAIAIITRRPNFWQRRIVAFALILLCENHASHDGTAIAVDLTKVFRIRAAG
jgi:hypothetical protein